MILFIIIIYLYNKFTSVSVSEGSGLFMVSIPGVANEFAPKSSLKISFNSASFLVCPVDITYLICF